ncbi:MAG: ATP-binding cassette domain-containing protein [Burkholderiales bacterium]|nr:ATP-binding cassette domain-containing protein [Burkholderiales bacterium]
MISIRNAILARGAKRLLDGASAAIHAGMRVGVVGANGTGKSTLFAALRGELHPEGGDIDVPAGWTIAHVAQETPALETPAIEYVLDGDAELREIERALAAAEAEPGDAEGHGERLAHLHDRYGAVDGYSARARAAELLSGLGFATGEHARPVASFSGGWRMRLNLAQALMTRSDLLLLDEPTNHLDLDAIIWLERWLASYAGTLLLISHDRDFLDAIVGAILHFDQGKLRLYTGNYSAFEVQRAAALAQQAALYARQQREIARLESFVNRFRAKATKARQAQSRIKALERMERIVPAHVDSPFSFRFRERDGAPDPMLRLAGASAGYGGEPVLADVELTIRAGARIGLLGANGAGKSTLMKLLAGRLAPGAGERIEGKGLAVGYFAQHQLEDLREDDTPLGHLQRMDRRTREQELRDFLGGFDFAGDAALRPVAGFSGGERARLALALVVWQRPNLLLLDEPTNHLDLDMREALEVALAEYDGAMVLVSHDRHLLATAVDELCLVADRRVAPFDGDLDDYARWLLERRAPRREKQAAASERRAERRAEAEARQALAAKRKPVLRKLERLEAEMAKLADEKRRAEAALAAPEFYAGGDQNLVTETLRAQSRLAAKLEALEAEWLALQEALEAIGAANA